MEGKDVLDRSKAMEMLMYKLEGSGVAGQGLAEYSEVLGF